MSYDTNEPRPKAVLVGIQLPFVEYNEQMSSLAELGRLVDTLGFEVIATLSQRRQRLHPGTVLGSGKLKELAEWTGGPGEVPTLARRKKEKKNRTEQEDEATDTTEPSEELQEDGQPGASTEDGGQSDALAPGSGNTSTLPTNDDGEQPGVLASDSDDLSASDDDPEDDEWAEIHDTADVIVFNHELTPMQLRNLELATEAEILDRNGVIIEIFHRHAKTKEARLQIEIAQLKYTAPRLRLSQNKGDRQTGGIGGKGAGETKHELNQRRIRDRIAELHQQLNAIAKEEGIRRKRRKKSHSVALVGYTNAGKSSLMRRLTSDSTYVADKLFATLGTTVRVMQPEGKPRVLVSDTVGFIKDLPHDLVASFRSTLEEAQEASLLLHVIDVSDPDYRSQLEVTRTVLSELKTQDVPLLLVFNKKDLLDDLTLYDIEIDFPDAIFMSAHDPKDMEKLKARIIAFFEKDMVEEDLYVPFSEGQWIGEIHKQVRVLDTSYDDGGTILKVRANPDTLKILQKKIKLSCGAEADGSADL